VMTLFAVLTWALLSVNLKPVVALALLAALFEPLPCLWAMLFAPASSSGELAIRGTPGSHTCT
jgi:hypothetical protein